MPPEHQSRRLSWIEVALLALGALVVIALVLPAVQVSRESARRQQSRNNLAHLGLALRNYHDNFLVLPLGGTFREDGTPLHSWTFFLNCYMAQVAPYFVIDSNLPWDDPVNWSPMSHWQGRFEKLVNGSSITHVDVKGIFDPQELRLLLSLPTLKTISLDGNAPLAEVADVLKEFPNVRVIDGEPHH